MIHEQILSDNPRKIDSLTGARFFAIIIIVFSHFEFLEKYGEFGKFYSSYLHNPTMGVDFFFMLSGFGMMYSSLFKDPNGNNPIGGVKGIINFGKKHIRKIYKFYVFSLLLGIPYYCLTCGDSIVIGILKSAVYFTFDLTLLQSATGIMAFSHSLNGVCWFLSSLFCIYLFSPLILKFLQKHIKSIKSALTGILVSIVISFILLVIFKWIEERTIFDIISYVSPFRRVFYVIPGMLLAQILFFRNKNGRELKIFMYGSFEYLTLCSSMVWFFLRNTISEQIGSSIVFLDMIIVCCNLYALAIGKGVFSGLLSSKTMVYLGNISMYIFLFHYNIRVYIDYFMHSLGYESIAVGIIEVFIILFLSFLLSFLIDYFSKKRSFARKCE